MQPVPSALSAGGGMTTTGIYRLSAKDRRYIDRVWRYEREATLKMIDAFHEWNKVSDEVNDWLARSGHEDIVDRTDRRAANLSLQSALKALEFWRGQVIALTAAIQAEDVARKLMELDT